MLITHMRRFTAISSVTSASQNVEIPRGVKLKSTDAAVMGTSTGPLYLSVGLSVSDLQIAGGGFVHHLASGFSHIDTASGVDAVHWDGEVGTVVDRGASPQINILYANRTGTDQDFQFSWSYDDGK